MTEASEAPLALPFGTLQAFTSPDYCAPCPEDVRTLKEMSGLTGRELALLVGLADQRTFRRWSAPAESVGAKQIPYACWRLLLVELKLV